MTQASMQSAGGGGGAGAEAEALMRPKLVDFFKVNEVRCVGVATGCLHSCAVASDGSVFTWGAGVPGTLGHLQALEHGYAGHDMVGGSLGMVQSMVSGMGLSHLGSHGHSGGTGNGLGGHAGFSGGPAGHAPCKVDDLEGIPMVLKLTCKASPPLKHTKRGAVTTRIGRKNQRRSPFRIVKMI